MPTKSVLLTGATGFIGRHMAALLVARNCEVVSLQRSTEPVNGISQTLALSDIELGTIVAALGGRKFDWLVHLAGYGVRPQDRDTEKMFSVNVDMARRLVQRAAS
jgi:UDP-glucose 4-epimerase